MELKDWLLPLLTLGAGVLTLFTDKDKRPSIKRLLLGGMIVTVAITIALNGTDTSKTHAQKTKDEKRIDDLIGIAKAANVNAANASNTANDILKRVKSWGLQPSEVTNVVTSIKADEARKEALVDVKLESTPRPRVMYFPKDVDGPVVIKALREANFQVESGRPVVTSVPTNMIWVGDFVSIPDVRFVALTLVRAGVKIVAIRRFLDSTGPKAHLIEIGAYEDLNDLPPLSVEAIQNLTSIPRDTDDSYDELLKQTGRGAAK